MSMSAAQRVDLWLRQATPVALTVLLAVLSAVPTGVPGYSAVVPGYTAMAAFYWAVFRPDLQPPFSMFLVGLLPDILVATPLGLPPLSLMIVHGPPVFPRPALPRNPP